MFVLTTGGTTIMELARLLPEQLRATFITGSLPAALEYIQHPNLDVIFIGDRISRNSQITVGGEAIWKIRQIKADICFLGINAIDINNGITDSDWEVVQVKRAMIESSQQVVAISISEKINTTQKIEICGLKKIDLLITELPPEDPLLIPYRSAGLQVI
jgi:DeoR/GlpR family transcriptional regulator of sugar metabolism